MRRGSRPARHIEFPPMFPTSGSVLVGTSALSCGTMALVGPLLFRHRAYPVPSKSRHTRNVAALAPAYPYEDHSHGSVKGHGCRFEAITGAAARHRPLRAAGPLPRRARAAPRLRPCRFPREIPALGGVHDRPRTYPGRRAPAFSRFIPIRPITSQAAQQRTGVIRQAREPYGGHYRIGHLVHIERTPGPCPVV